MNTHDKYELPPLPDLFGHFADGKLAARINQALEEYARAAIEANRKLTAKQLSAYESLVASLEAKCTHMRKMYDELKDRTNPDLLASERAANAILTAELEADRKRRGEPVNEEELLAAREALIDMGYLWDGDQWVDVDPPSKTAEQAPEWPDFARMEASLQRLKERLVFENGRRKDLEQRLREKRNG